jgi:hypothetical protein
MPPGPRPLLESVAEILEDLGIRYCAGGSVASSAHGVFRQTADIDLVLELPSEKITRLVERLSGEFYIDEEAAAEAVRLGTSFNAIHFETVEKCDFFVPNDSPWTREQLGRRVRAATLQGGTPGVWLLSAECTIVQKLHWRKLGGNSSDQQWRDVLGVLAIRGRELDLSYLQEWADHLGVSDELLEALNQGHLIEAVEIGE